MTSDRARRAGGAGPLSHDYWRFWAAASVSNLGDGLRLVALPLLALQVTSDPLLIAGVTALNFVPWILVGPVSGAVVDRVDRRRLLLAVQLLRGVVLATFAFTVAMDAVTIWSLYAVTIMIAAGETIADSAAQASIPYLVDLQHLERANGRLVSAEIVTNEVAGGPLGGLLFAAAAILPFAADAATYLLAAVLVSLVRTHLGPFTATRDSQPAANLRADIAEGFRFVFTHPVLRPITLATALVNLGSGAVSATLVIFAVHTIGLSEVGFGFLLGIGAVGGLLGAMAAPRLVTSAGRRTSIVGSAVIVAAGSLGLATIDRALPLTVGWFIISAATATSNVVTRSLRQAATPDRLLGRMVTSIRLVGLGAIPLGAVVGGLLARGPGIRTTFVFGGGAVTAAGVVLATMLDPGAIRAEGPGVLADAVPDRTASR